MKVPHLASRIISLSRQIKNENLSRRDHFAMAAMQGFICSKHRHDPIHPGDLANNSAECADALIAELDGNDDE